jgi:GT2 family glycosyltransferase
MTSGAAAPPLRLAAIVLNYRTPALVLDCLTSLVPELDPARDAAVVVDNASGDESAEAIRRRAAESSWKSVRVVESPRNGGFAAGNNVGIRSVAARAYLLLNSDTLVRRGAVAPLLQTLEADPTVGIVSPRLEWPDGTPQISCFRPHNPTAELIYAAGTGPIRKLLERWDVPLPVSDSPFEPGWTSFAAVLIRAAVLDEVGLLDEGFFMYYEDEDYCRRARQAGWRIRHEPGARVVHLRGGTSPVKALSAARKRRPRYYYASRSRCFRKAYGPAGLLSANLLYSVGRAIAWSRELVGNKLPHAAERELLDTWRG